MDEYKKAYSRFSKEQSLIIAKEDAFNKLATMEYDGLKEEPEFLKQIRVIDLIDELLREKIKNERYSLKDLIYSCTYIKNELFELGCKDEESIILKQTDLPYRRLFKILFNITLSKLEKANKMDSIMELSIFNYKSKTPKHYIDLDTYVNEDINRIYLSTIEESIKNCKDKDLKKELIEAKYKLIFLSENLESEMMLNNFKIDRTIPIKADFLLRFLDIPSDISNKLITNIIEKNISRNKKHILEYSDKEMKNNQMELVLRSCYMRANLFLVTEESILQDNINYYEEVSKRAVFDGYSKGDKIITDTYSNAIKDKAKYKALCIK